MCLHNLQVIICLAVFVSITIQIPDRNYILVFHNFTCHSYSKTLARPECSFKNDAISSYKFSVRMMFTKDMSSYFFVRFYVDLQRNGKKRLKFLDIKLKACEAIRVGYENYIVKYVVLEIRRAGNFPYQCPFKKNVAYEVRNLTYSAKYLLSKIPPANFTFGVEFYDRKELIGSIIAPGAIESKNKLKKA